MNVSTRKQALLILGCAGGETATLARSLEAMGTVQPAPERIVTILDTFLTSVGSGWDDPAPLPGIAFWGRPAVLCHDEVLDLVDPDAPIVVFSDPRFCRLVPLWRRMMRTLNRQTQAVLMVEPPLVAAAPMRAAGVRSRDSAFALWLSTLLCAERDTRDLRRSWIHRDDLIADPGAAMRALAAKLGCFSPTRVEEALPTVAAHWRPRQEVHPAGDEAEVETWPAWVAEAYDGVRRVLAGSPLDSVRLDALSARLSEATSLFRPWLDLPTQTRRELVRQGEALALCRAESERWRAVAAERERCIAALERDRRAACDRAERLAEERDRLAIQTACVWLGRSRRLGWMSWPRRVAGLLAAAVRGRLRQRLRENRDIQLIARSGQFDAAYYLARHPDVLAAGVDPLIHYVRCGAREGRRPHPRFDAAFYGRTYPDVARAGANPLAHYLRFGAGEGRQPAPEAAPGAGLGGPAWGLLSPSDQEERMR